MHRQKLAGWFEPAQDRLDILVTAFGIDGAVERVFEQPIKWSRWRVRQKIGKLELRRQARLGGFFLTEAKGGGRQVVAESFEACLGPGARIVTAAATGHADCSSGQ